MPKWTDDDWVFSSMCAAVWPHHLFQSVLYSDINSRLTLPISPHGP